MPDTAEKPVAKRTLLIKLLDFCGIASVEDEKRAASNARKKAYRLANKTKIAAAAKAYRLANPEKLKAYAKAYHGALKSKADAYAALKAKADAYDKMTDMLK